MRAWKALPILALALFVLIECFAACSVFQKAARISARVLEFINAVDMQAEAYCASGWLPEKVCEQYYKVRNQATSRWDSARTEFLIWVAKFLGGEYSPPAASTAVDAHDSRLGAPPSRPASEEILAAAYAAFNEGDLTADELAMLEKAGRR